VAWPSFSIQVLPTDRTFSMTFRRRRCRRKTSRSSVDKSVSLRPLDEFWFDPERIFRKSFLKNFWTFFFSQKCLQSKKQLWTITLNFVTAKSHFEMIFPILNNLHLSYSEWILYCYSYCITLLLLFTFLVLNFTI